MKAHDRPAPSSSPASSDWRVSCGAAHGNNLELLFGQVPALMAILSGDEGVVQLINPALQQLWGGREVLGKTMRTAWPELEGQGYFELIEQVYRTGEAVSRKEYPGMVDRQNNGELEQAYFSFVYQPYHDQEGKIIGVIVFGLDVTDQVHARQKLEESEQRFRSMADTAPVMIWVAGVDRKCTYFNKGWLDFTGRRLEQDLGDGWTEDIHPDDLDRCWTAYHRAFDARELYTSEYRLRRMDGVYRRILDRGAPRFSHDGEFLGYVGSCSDVEDIKRGRELEEVNKALRREQRHLLALSKAKDEFISIASHQLRTPASAVKQYVGMLLAGYAGELTETQRHMLTTAYESNQRQLMIVDDLLKVARVDAGKLKVYKVETNMQELIDEVIQEQAGKLTVRGQIMASNVPEEPVFAHVDRKLFRMVLENMIDNASKYSAHHTMISMRLSVSSARLRMVVEDQGVGISLKDQQKLFQKFTRITNPLSAGADGTGLGLYWVKRVVALHGGTIKVESKVGKGTSFIISLPL